MVKSHSLMLVLAASLLLMAFVGNMLAWTGSYHLDKEWVKIWINQDGTIDLFYNITITLDSGDNINFVTVGQPNGDFTIGEAFDQYSHTLATEDTSQGSQYQAKVSLNQPLTAGHSLWFTLLTNVAQMIFNDSAMNPGNLGMQFIPSWYSATVQDLRVSIVLPPGVTQDVIRTQRDYDNVFTEGDQLVVYWEHQNLSPDEKYTVGVSFPQEYMPSYVPPNINPPSDGNPPPAITLPNFYQYFIILFIVGAVFLSVFVGIAVSKRQYFAPTLSMETLGIKRGLTAVEASYLLEMKPTRIVTEILYSLLQKRAIWVEAARPSLKLRIMPKFQDPRSRKELLRYYETDFVNAITPEGTLDEVKLAETVMGVRDTVEEKMRGYCRRDTMDYYKSVTAKAWQQAEQAGTPELASNAYDEQLLWLLLDPDVRMRTQTVFKDRAFEPSPMWFWYWYGYSHYNPHPTYTPNINAPAQAAKPPIIPGADFANNIATSLEKTANNIVVNVEKFANSILPAPPSSKASHEPARHGATCVCACHACACACACVSCACACAGGGVG
jgi:hypothetical protein